MPDRISATDTVEEYLEAILNMASENRKVIGSRLAERLQVSRPTVTATLKRMTRDGLIIAKGRHEILLTNRGMELAIGIVRRHRLAERLLTDFLKIPWHESHQEACLLEHAISDRVLERLWEVLGKPAACPHGNPVPVNGVLPPLSGLPLNECAVGSFVIVERISEEANRLNELMQFFEDKGIKPGAKILIKEIPPYTGTMTLIVGKNDVSLGTKAAALVWARPVQP